MSEDVSSTTRPAAIVLIAVALLSVFAMLHHPTIASHTVEDALAEVAHERSLNATVHGAMIAVVVLYLWAFSALSDRFDFRRGTIRLARIGSALATGAFVGAALISGFVTPEFAQKAAEQALSRPAVRTALVTLHAGNQALADFATVAYGAAIVAWGSALVRQHGSFNRAIGLVGLIIGSSMLALMLFAGLTLGVMGMSLVTLLLAIWACAAGVWLWRAPRSERIE